MATSLYILLVGLVVSATGRFISSNCTDVCNSDAKLSCRTPCTLDDNIESILTTVYGQEVVKDCLTPCSCQSDRFVYQDNGFCRVLQSFAAKVCECKETEEAFKANLAKWNIQEPATYARKDVIEYLTKREVGDDVSRKLRAEPTTQNPWENWCKHQCAEGLGGSACYCDIIP